ncbi:hypothetical protein BKP45_09715 [Anaerobacillus alkalidiazotrophicus]|uniref:DUF4142 domain-containing protein n=1 Tax=Anaerobacillus alkalidiazotrophicus TaxID=472963 RepID=A0A1S2M6C3_9BACI|nr:hypothetical protein [Anaerobacillus alkalidiazotrophicus]OIJ20332.1 hypothetical protein BKP45_09715 [Anaerobacillus alkalidiazotrophicus]
MKCRKKLLLLLMITSILVSFTSLPIVNANEDVNEEASSQVGKIGFEQRVIRAHFNFYYQLLAEKYAPKHVKVWNNVMQDRDALIKKFKELKKDGIELDNFYDETWLKEHNEIQHQFLEAVEKRDDEILKVIVPQIIDHQKQLNSILKKRLKELK